MPTILILGGSYVGIRVAHSLLKTTAKTVSDLKIILVTKVLYLPLSWPAPARRTWSALHG